MGITGRLIPIRLEARLIRRVAIVGIYPIYREATMRVQDGAFFACYGLDATVQ
jgi:hypothetical protein